jgi:hypothetical protein
MKIYLSSAETAGGTKVLMDVKQPKNLLVSYYYLRSWKDEKVVKLLEDFKKQGNSLFLDSGAHSFLNEVDSLTVGRKSIAQKKKTRTKGTPEEYFEKYLKFLKKYQHYFDLIAELDIDLIVGYKKVVEWRDNLRDIGIENSRLVLVYHPTIPNWTKEWEMWAKQGYCLGIGSFPSKEIHNYLFSVALKYKARVHGFAMTKNDYLLEYPWYSVDSSSWNIGQRYGCICYYDKKTYRVKTFKTKTILESNAGFLKFQADVWPKISGYLKISFKDFMYNRRKNSHYLDFCNVFAYMHQEKGLTELWSKRGINF